MIHCPTISIINCSTSEESSCSIKNEIQKQWPGSTPPCTVDVYKSADIVLLFATKHAELLSHLSVVLELHDLKIPTLIICDDLGDLKQLLEQLNMSAIPTDVEPSMLIGTIFGMLKRSEEVSELRSKLGLMKTLHGSVKAELQQLQDELDSASVVQREFMSNDVHSVHGTSFTTLWKPLGVVSGDMFDITQLDDDHVAFFIADAIGHGISAAMLSMMLTRTLASNRFDPLSGDFTEPKVMLTILNHALLQRTGDQARFATAAYGILNCKTNLLTYAGAGHPPALLNKSNCSYQLLDSDGPLLGVFNEDNDFKQNTIQLDTGDTLLIYSDGVEGIFGSSSTNDGSISSHIEVMRRICNNTIGEDVLSKIDTALYNMPTRVIEDDLTMICLQTCPNTTASNVAA